MSLLATKRRRDMRRRRGRVAAVFTVVVLGVGLGVASYDAYRNLSDSYDLTYRRLAFADVTVSGADALFAESARRLEGIAAISTRRVADVPVRVGNTTLEARLVGLPNEAPPTVNRVDVVRGSPLDASTGDGVLVEKHLADHFDVGPGDHVSALLATGWTSLSAEGVAVSAEYLWPARSRQEIFAGPDDFGVLFVADSLLDEVHPRAVVSQTLLRYSPGADRNDLDSTVAAAARSAGAAQIATRAEQASNAALSLDVEGFAEMAVLFPLLFVFAAGLALWIALTVIVNEDRGVIGTLRANGLSRSAVYRHYASFGLAIGTGAAVVGAALGVVGGWSLAGFYTSALGIPDTSRRLHPLTPVAGVLFGALAGFLAALAPARRAARLDPVDAMRGSTPGRRASRSALEVVVPPLRRLPVRWRMMLRGIGRSRRRSLSTIAGVVVALTVVLAAWGMIDTVSILLHRQFEVVDRQDTSISFTGQYREANLQRIREVPGVRAAEALLRLPVTIRSADDEYTTELIALGTSTEMHGFGERQPGDGVVLGLPLRSELGVRTGDVVSVGLSSLGTTVDLPVDGFADEPLGTFAYADRDAIGAALAAADPRFDTRTLGAPGSTLVYARFDDTADHRQVLEALRESEGIAVATDERALYRSVQEYLGLFYAFVGAMVLFGSAIAFGLLFNTTSANLAERSSELATLRSEGMSNGQIARLVAAENLLLTCVGIVPGLIVGTWSAARFLDGFSSDLFSFGLELRPATLPLAAVAMIATASLSLVPGLRAVAHLDVAAVTRERSI